jgi:hypothetical protein
MIGGGQSSGGLGQLMGMVRLLVWLRTESSQPGEQVPLDGSSPTSPRAAARSLAWRATKEMNTR